MRVKTEPETFNQNPISAALKLNNTSSALTVFFVFVSIPFLLLKAK